MAEIKEPRVKMLNAVVAAMAADVLLNQLTQRQIHAPILVFANNKTAAMYRDESSVANHHKNCCFCSRS